MDLRLGTLTRRSALRRLGSLSALAVGDINVARAVPALEIGGTPTAASAPKPQSEPQLREFVLTASEFDWELMPDTTVRAWGYNGQLPGPEIRVGEGDRVRVTLRNQLSVPTTIHWHGVNVPPAMDGPAGLNQAPVEPGAEFVYDFVATPAGSRWYHSHADPALQVPLGLYGPIIVEPRSPLRVWDRDYTVVLAEWDLELTPDVAAGRTARGPRDRLLRGGELGSDLFLMNGKMHGAIPPIALATGDRVLIRLMHAGALPHVFHTHGHSFKVVATDGHAVPLGVEWVKDSILIGPSERYDLEFVGDNPGVWMVHCHMEHHMANGMMTIIQYDGATPSGPAAAFLGATSAFPGAHPHSMAPEVPPSTTPATTTGVDLDIEPSTVASNSVGTAASTTPLVEVAMVDDRYEAPDLIVAVGTTLRFVNRGANWHSVAAFDGSFESGRVDPGGSFEVRLDTPGVYQFLCKHHGMQGMVGRVTVT